MAEDRVSFLKKLFYFIIVFKFYFLESEEGSQVQGPSVNESRQEEDEPPLATMSQKLDDDSILEALEVHEKLKCVI